MCPKFCASLHLLRQASLLISRLDSVDPHSVMEKALLLGGPPRSPLVYHPVSACIQQQVSPVRDLLPGLSLSRHTHQGHAFIFHGRLYPPQSNAEI